MTNSRRRFLTGTAAAAAFGALGPGMFLSSGTALAAVSKGASALNLRKDGTYATAELAKPAWNLGLIQSRVHTFEMGQLKSGMKRNLAHMLQLIDNACYYGPHPDLVLFHEFPLTGWRKWTREESLKLSIEIPGEETEALSKKAREYDIWIAFGAYVRDPDWPGHVLSITTLINNRGEVVAKHWKARNIKGVFHNFELFTTTTYDVLDRYVEMYGRDEVVPVARTPLGNITLSSTQREPELFRAAAMKGAEIFLRTATGGFEPLDVAATSLYNGTYTAIVNNSISPDNAPFFDDPYGFSGGTALYGPDGKMVAEARGKHEQMALGRIPIAELRARKRQPVLHMDLYRDVFEAYESPYAPNLWSQYVPHSLEDAHRFVKDKSRWK